MRWLITNLITALVPATIVFFFDATIAQKAVLAALMPIVAGVGGNAGTQTLAVTVRALATNQLTQSNTIRTIRREISIAILNGVTVATAIGLAVAVLGTVIHDLSSNGALPIVIAAAMLANILIAGLAGVLVPVALERFRQDPAVASSIFVTMVTDSMGFLAFLGLASMSGLVG